MASDSETLPVSDCDILIRRSKILNTIQHFDTTAEDFTDVLFNISIDDFIAEMPEVKSTLQKLFGNAAEIDIGIEKLIKYFYAKLQKNSEILEKYLEEAILDVPVPISQYVDLSCSQFTKVPNKNTIQVHMLEIQKLKHHLEEQEIKKRAIRLQLQRLNDLEVEINTFAEIVTQYSNEVNQPPLSSLLQEMFVVVNAFEAKEVGLQ